MREKILAQLKVYLKTLGVANLSTARLNAIADKLAPKITDEKDIDAKLEELNEIFPFSDIAKQDDQLRTFKTKKPEVKPPVDDDDEPETVEPDKPKPKKENETLKLLKALTATVEALKTEKAQTTIRQKIAERLKNVPEIFYDGRTLPEKEEDIEDWAVNVEAKVTAFKQDKKNEGLLGNPKPLGGGGASTETPTGKEEADIAKWAEAESKKDEKKN